MSPDPIQSAEELREALLGLRRAHEALQVTSAQNQHLLDALASLLGLHDEDDPFLRVIAALRKVFTFTQAMMLGDAAPSGSEPAAALHCMVADPMSLVGSTWPVGPAFRKVMGGRVVATLSTEGTAEWAAQAQALALPPQPSALYVPVRVRDQRGILVLLRPSGGEGFDRVDVDLGGRFSLLVSHALASHHARQTAAEGQRLRELTEQLRRSEQTAQRNADLLNQVVSSLPVGLAVQDESGCLLVINDAAAKAFGHKASELQGQVPFGVADATPEEYHRRLAQFRRQIDGGHEQSREREVVLEDRRCTMLINSKPVQVFDERLLLTAMLDITDRKRFERELTQRAFYDDLTGLPNRALMEQLVTAALRDRQVDGRFALAFIDMDNFKQVNDFYSHAIGDGLLRAAAERIRHNIRIGDTLARISGDEFLLLIDPLDRIEDLAPLIERVADALKQPFDIEGQQILTSASLGASIFPVHGTSYEALRRSADNAMYRAKRDRKGSVGYFEHSMGNALTARMDMEQKLRAAIREQRFKAAFQPKVDIASGAIVGFEALIRWIDADQTVRLPGSFIDLATELGLLDSLTHFVLDDVIASLPQLRRRFGADTSVSINIGAKQAGSVEFMQSVMQRLTSDTAPSLVFELTEEALVATRRFQRQVLPRLREMGVRVSIDDFGTGYSSLSTLSDITADEVKVDRAFITSLQDRPRSQGILRAIESLCSALKVDVVAEGVETENEFSYLRRHSSIRCAQGYFFSKPVFLDEVLALPRRLTPCGNTRAAVIALAALPGN